MASVGGAAARGVETGFRLAQDYQAAEERKRATGVQEARQREQDVRAERQLALTEERTVEQTERQKRLDEQTVLKNQLDAANTAYKSFDEEATNARIAGQTLPAGWYERASQVYQQRQSLLDKLMQPGKDTASRIHAGQVSIDDISDADFAQSIMASTRSTPQQLEQYSQGVADVHAGLESNNRGLLIKGANAILSRDLNQGVGEFTPTGHRIVRKELIGLDPARGADGRDHPDMVIPRVRVYVDKDDDGQPDTYYDAPLTEGRSTDPQAKVKAVPVSKLFDGLGAVGIFSEVMKNPAVAKKFQAGVEASRGWMAQVFDIAGAAKQKRFTVDERLALMASIDEQVRAGTITPEQGEERKRVAAGGKPVTGLEAAKTKLTEAQTAAVPQLTAAKTTQAKAALLRAASKEGAGGAAGSIGQGANDPETVDFWARAVIAGDRDWQTNMGRSKAGGELVAAVKSRVPKLAKEMGLEPQDIGSTRAQQVALTKTLADRTKYVTSVEQLTDTLDRQAALVESLLEKGVATNVGKLANAPIQSIRSALGSADLAAFDTALTGMAREHQRVLTSPLSNAQLHVAAQETADRLANRNMTRAELKAVIAVMRKEAENGKTAGATTLQHVKDQINALGRGRGTGVGAAQTAPTAAPVAAVPGTAARAAAPVAAPKEGDKQTSKSGKPMVYAGGKWVYE